MSDDEKKAIKAYETNGKEGSVEGASDDSGYTFAMVGTAAIAASFLL